MTEERQEAADADETEAQGPTDPAECTTTSAKVRYIAALMASGQYLGRKTIKQLSDVWQLSASHVRNLTGEASRRVLDAVSDETYRSLLIERLEHIAELAEAGQASAAVNALKLAAELRGLHAEKHVHSFEHLGKDEVLSELGKLGVDIAFRKRDEEPGS